MPDDPGAQRVKRTTKPLSSDPMFQNVNKTLSHMKEAATLLVAGSEALMRHVSEHELSVDQRIKANGELLTKHLNDPNQRPTVARSLNKKIYTLALNDQIYRYGPRDEKVMAVLSDDEPSYFWEHADAFGNEINLHACLFAILTHFCKREAETVTQPTSVSGQ